MVIVFIQLIGISCSNNVVVSNIEISSEINLSTTILDTNLPARNDVEMIESNGSYWFMGGKTPKQGDNIFFNNVWNSTDGIS